MSTEQTKNDFFNPSFEEWNANNNFAQDFRQMGYGGYPKAGGYGYGYGGYGYPHHHHWGYHPYGYHGMYGHMHHPGMYGHYGMYGHHGMYGGTPYGMQPGYGYGGGYGGGYQSPYPRTAFDSAAYNGQFNQFAPGFPQHQQGTAANTFSQGEFRGQDDADNQFQQTNSANNSNQVIQATATPVRKRQNTKA